MMIAFHIAWADFFFGLFIGTMIAVTIAMSIYALEGEHGD